MSTSSVLDKESVADSFFNSRNDSIHSLDRAGSSLLDNKNKDEWKQSLSMAYEKGLMKERCGFCKMYFHRNSVNFKVPNHRIHRLEQSWGMKKEGRRYQNAAFLYRMIDVCKFCSQFFALMPEDEKKIDDPLRPMKETAVKLNITTQIERSDIAQHKRSYQCSEVDNKEAGNAVSPPYTAICRTRRELDPWWEVDFGRRYHVLDLSFLLSTGIRQQLLVHVFLLPRSIGFEDPFIDSIASKAIMKKTFHVTAQNQSIMEPIQWKLPDHTICAAVRVQLQGIHTLGLQRFQAHQGDDVVTISQSELNGDLTAVSLATLSPQRIKTAMHDMESPEQRKKKIKERDLSTLSLSERAPSRSMEVPTLRYSISAQYQAIEDWKARVTDCASIFPPHEVTAMYKVIFKYAADLNLHEEDAVISEYDLMGTALTHHYPRCQLPELSKRIRAVLSLIHQRSQLKQLMGLHNSDNFGLVSSDPAYYVKQLNIVFDKLQDYWAKKEQREKLEQAKSKTRGIAGTTAAEARGCSWSQFLIVMRYFCTQQVQNIPAMAFNVDFKKTSTVQDFHRRYSELAGIAQYQKRMSMFGPTMITGLNTSSPDLLQARKQNGAASDTDSLAMSMPSLHTINSTVPSRAQTPGSRASSRRGNNRMGSRSAHFRTMQPASRLDALATPIFNRSMQPLTIDMEPPTLLESARASSDFPFFDSRCSEYKFANFKRRTALEPTFPKTLSLEFARSLMPTRGVAMHGTNAAMATILSDFYAENADNAADGGAAGGDEGAPVDSADDRTQATLDSSQLFGDSGMFQRTGTGQNLQRMGTGRGLRRIPTVGVLEMSDPLAAMAAFENPSKPGMTPKGGMRLQRSSSSKQLALALDSPMRGAKSGLAPWQESGAFGALTPSRGAPMTSPIRTNRLRAVGRLVGAFSAVNRQDAFSASLDGGPSDDNDDDDHISKKHAAPPPPVDFFRVCGLCELRFPRHAIEMKVLRKHIVKLRDSWDPSLVSKEIRLLDNTISMYNLINVCRFCSQFFDPDFDDGIAYPVQIDSPLPKQKNTLTAITSQRVDTKLIPYYDTRFPSSVHAESSTEGVLSRPQTTEARQNARRAKAVAKDFEDRQQQFLEQVAAHEKKNKK